MRRDRTIAPTLASGAAIIMLGFAVPLLIAKHYHALGVPRGDDWSYLRSLYHWVDTGHLNFNFWVSMTLVGQLILAAPIALVRGHDTTSVQILTAVLGLVGLFATAAAARRCGVGRGAATFLAAVVAAGPFFGVLTVSFMTDVPAFGCSALSLLVGIIALQRGPISLPLLAGSLALGLYAFTMREYGAIPVIAVALAAAYALLVGHDRRRLGWLVAMAAVTAIGAVAFYVWWRTIPDPKPFPLGQSSAHAISTANVKGAGMTRLAGFWLLPVVLLVGPIALVRRAWTASRVTTLVIGALTGVWLVATGLKQPRNAFTGNYFIPEGALGHGVGSGARPRLISLRMFDLLVAAGTVGGVIVVVAAVPGLVMAARALRRREFPALDGAQLGVLAIALATAGYAAAYALLALAGSPLYDRYTLPVVPLAGVLLLRSRVTAIAPAGTEAPPRFYRWRTVWAGLAFAALLAVGLDYTADSASYDAARWRVAERAVAAGWAPRQVGGNFEWVNFYSPNPGTSRRTHAVCVLVTVGNPADLSPELPRIAIGTYSPPLHKSLPVIALRTNLPCKPQGRAPR